MAARRLQGPLERKELRGKMVNSLLWGHETSRIPPRTLERSGWHLIDAEVMKQHALVSSCDGKQQGKIPLTLLASGNRSLTSTPPPVAIYVHATGKDRREVEPRLINLARKGFLGIAMDARMHGMRVDDFGRLCWETTENYARELRRAWEEDPSSRPFLFSSAVDISHVVDWLEQESIGDTQRVGVGGISLGGMITWLAAAADERISSAVPEIGVQSFRHAIENGLYMPRVESLPGPLFRVAAEDLQEGEVTPGVVERVWRRIAPGICDEIDAPFSLQLLAPRPVLIVNAELDKRCPKEGVELSVRAAREAYEEHGKGENLACCFQSGVGHWETEEMVAIAERWLIETLINGKEGSSALDSIRHCPFASSFEFL